jgi:hypothetical protein
MDVAQELREYAEDCEETDSYGAWRQIDQSKLLGWANQLDQDRKPVDLTQLDDNELHALNNRLMDEKFAVMDEIERRKPKPSPMPQTIEEQVAVVMDAMHHAAQ